MLFSAIFAGLCLLTAPVRGQNATSAYVDPSVPTGTPIPGDYTGALRPQIHYSPPKGFMVRACLSLPCLPLYQLDEEVETGYALVVEADQASLIERSERHVCGCRGRVPPLLPVYVRQRQSQQQDAV